MSAQPEWDSSIRLVDLLLEEQRTLSAVDEFAAAHSTSADLIGRYSSLIPVGQPEKGQQLAFQVDLDSCTGCKACVTACHSLNGLEEEETWRTVGLLDTERPTSGGVHQQTVTAACHHCAEPACLSGCPVRAYEKDEVTGIVRHLDDQCIGCRYCQLMCPYDVPTWSERLGIVRKCDMCHERLAEGEAPACVQGCPNEAISIAIVDRDPVQRDASLLSVTPGAVPPSEWTSPTTQYLSEREVHIGMDPADRDHAIPNHPHMPLVVMLVLTQAAMGAVWSDSVQGLGVLSTDSARVVVPSLALVLGFAGLGASFAHLGRPQWAFRAVLGLRTSWMSREIVALGGFAGTLVAIFVAAWVSSWNLSVPSPLVSSIQNSRELVSFAATGMAGIGLLCSIQIYAVTRRPFWSFRKTAARFVGTAAWVGTSVAHLSCFAGAETTIDSPTPAQVAIPMTLMILTAFRLWSESGWLVSSAHSNQTIALARSRRLLSGVLRREARARVTTLAMAGIGGPLLSLVLAVIGVSPWVLGVVASGMLVLGLFSEMIERRLFFRAEAMPAMPGEG